jgi:hypothetical protein
MAAGIAGRIYHQLNDKEYSTKQETEARIAVAVPPPGQ